MSTKTLYIIMSVAIAAFVVTCITSRENVSSEISEIQKTDKKIFTFVLTHGANKELKQPAHFVCGDTPTWILNFNNGNVVKYEIISGNEQNSLCDLRARDSNGDECEICVTPKPDNKILVEFKYGTRTMKFDGLYSQA